ncbi:hypothetical protein C9I89_16420 [Photobacterium lipolyticum]|uniref:Uncharacterized protein n=1 Tax=Photobacterium lipolyticum TaxID=266810 RepID=A0A2T3MUX7_9GAMM|nr:hypothetical protein C9I89_16420 [Photobacterium lipolyticum]
MISATAHNFSYNEYLFFRSPLSVRHQCYSLNIEPLGIQICVIAAAARSEKKPVRDVRFFQGFWQADAGSRYIVSVNPMMDACNAHMQKKPLIINGFFVFNLAER